MEVSQKNEKEIVIDEPFQNIWKLTLVLKK